MGLYPTPAYIGVAAFLNTVENDRNVLEAMFQRTGLLRPGHFKVTPTGTARQVSVSAGNAILVGTENATQGAYMVWSDGADLYTFASAVTNPRIDTLVMRVVDEQYGVDPGDSRSEIEIVQGVAAASPVARADSYFNTGGAAYKAGAWYRLADVRINVVDGILPAGQITETLRYVRAAGRVICTSTTRPTDPAVGDIIFETNTGFERYFDGTNWPYMPGTIIKYGSNTAAKTWSSGAVVPYTRLDSIEIVANQQYIIHSKFLGSLATSGDTGTLYILVSTTGNATISDTQQHFIDVNASGAFVPAQTVSSEKPYSSASNVTLSILWAVGKAGGTGSFTIVGSSQTSEFWVEAKGPVQANTAVAL